MESNIKTLKDKIRMAEERKFHLRKITKIGAGEEGKPVEKMVKLHRHITDTAKNLGLQPGDNLPLEVLRQIEELMISVFEKKERVLQQSNPTLKPIIDQTWKDIDNTRKARKEQRNLDREMQIERTKRLKQRLKEEKMKKNKVHRARGKKMMRSEKPEIQRDDSKEEVVDEETLQFRRYVDG